MTPDLMALVATIILAMAQLGIASSLTLRQLGPEWVLSARDEARTVTGRSGRFVRAHRNLLEIFPQLVAALFVVHAAGAAATLSAWGAWTFFAARVAYVPAYVYAPPGVRPVCWQVAQLGIVVILLDLVL